MNDPVATSRLRCAWRLAPHQAEPKCSVLLACMQLINAALDISALFDARKDVIARATRFTSKAPPRKILQRIEEAVTSLNGTTKRREASARYLSAAGSLPDMLPLAC